MSFKKAPSIKHQCKGKYPMRNKDIVHAATPVEIDYKVNKETGKMFQVTGEYKNYWTGHYIDSFNQAVHKYSLRKMTKSEYDKFKEQKTIICGISLPIIHEGHVYL